MGIFNRKKNSSTSPVWRGADGKITCPGDTCSMDCNDSCPIWCQTLAIQAYQSDDVESAILFFRKALELAPDFKDAWNNLAAVYGGMNNHLEANKAYKAAYMLDKSYKNALFGMVVSFANLGQFEEALKYCDEFEQKFGKSEADHLRAQVNRKLSTGNTPRQETAIEMAVKIIDEARKLGFMEQNDKMPNIPEILIAAKEVCMKIVNDLKGQKNGNMPDIWLSWGAYAGIGAVYHWQTGWSEMKQKGIAETLLEPRGSFAMDEYVVDSIGIGYDTPEGKNFAQNVYFLSMWTLEHFIIDKPEEVTAQCTFEAMQSMYIMGMVLEMERLGMK